jgi:hypothetical protein
MNVGRDRYRDLRSPEPGASWRLIRVPCVRRRFIKPLGPKGRLPVPWSPLSIRFRRGGILREASG